jgi:translin
LKKAKALIQDSLQELKRLSKVSEEYPELYYGGILTPAQQEIAEASILAAIVGGADYPTFAESLISPSAYLLGMADAVGELRRLCLDNLRELKLRESSGAFAKMEEIFQALVEMDYPSGLTPGLRHKVDTARRLVEETRTDVTRAQLLIRTSRK